MGLFKKVFRGRALPAASGRQAPASEFADSEAAPVSTSWRALVRSRREAVHVVLRETMRQHAIPADWIESRLLVDTDDARLATFCILLLVRDGHSSLQGYAPTFQASFTDALRRSDPRSRKWLATICWNIDTPPSNTTAPEAAKASSAAVAGLVEPAASTQGPGGKQPDGLELEEDLQALFAIRDAALRTPPRLD